MDETYHRIVETFGMTCKTLYSFFHLFLAPATSVVHFWIVSVLPTARKELEGWGRSFTCVLADFKKIWTIVEIDQHFRSILPIITRRVQRMSQSQLQFGLAISIPKQNFTYCQLYCHKIGNWQTMLRTRSIDRLRRRYLYGRKPRIKAAFRFRLPYREEDVKKSTILFSALS